MAEIWLGVVADDFTGASDVASFLVDAGLSTVLFNGVPDGAAAVEDHIQAVVVALKSRTVPKMQAVEDSMAAFRWLKSIGAKHLYFKYCSTFDSTAKGNIGPVADAVLDAFQIPYTVLCPSLPVNGRTVKDGSLYVNGVLLEESHMKNHPLTPMTDSRIDRMMEAQSAYPAFCLRLDDMKQPDILHGACRRKNSRFYLVPDYYCDAHGDMIAELFGDLPFLTGGSGLCGALGRYYKKQQASACGNTERPALQFHEEERAIILAGSCSAVTLKQIADYRSKGYPSYRIRPEELAAGTQTVEQIMQWILKEGTNGLVYSSAAPTQILESQKLGKDRIASLIEDTFSQLAQLAQDAGIRRIIVAGGETSGAVTQALGYRSFYIGKSVAPGVPVMIPVDNTRMRLILKSGNFGQEDFFLRALTT